MPDRPLILITNDDGIQSPGLRAAVEAVMTLGEVIVIAPSRQHSATGRALLYRDDEVLRPVPFDVDGRQVPAYDADCSPAMTVQHGVQAVCGDRRPDLVVSGINYGENLGYNVTVSGTVGAALEAASLGIPGLAVSLETDHAYHWHYGEVDWEGARHFTRYFAARLLAWDHPDDCAVVNVNVPDEASADTPWHVTRLAMQSYFTAHLTDPQPEARMGDTEFGVFFDRARVAPGTDIHAILHDRVVSVTPLSLDLTARLPPAELATRLEAALSRPTQEDTPA